MQLYKTKRLTLSELQYSHLDDLMDLWGNAEVMKYCGGAGSRKQEENSLMFYLRMYEENGFSPYLVKLIETDEMIGVCGFNPPSFEHDAELMYHFKREYWGQGYATEAAIGCLEYARKSLSIKRIGASIDPANLASRKVLEKIGFVYVGVRHCEATGHDEPYFEFVL